MNLRDSRRRRFAEVLRNYRDQHKLSDAELGSLIQKPKSTVNKWLSGRRQPRYQELLVLCSRLNINYTALFNEGVLRDVFYDKQVIGIDALQYRYLENHSDGTFSALGFIAVAASVVYTLLMHEGLECKLECGPAFNCRLTFVGRAAMVNFSPRGLEGMGISVTGAKDQVLMDWRALNKTTLDLLIRILHNDHTNETRSR